MMQHYLVIDFLIAQLQKGPQAQCCRWRLAAGGWRELEAGPSEGAAAGLYGLLHVALMYAQT